MQHHISAVATAAATVSRTFPHIRYRFSTNQFKPLYIYGSSLAESYPSFWFNFNSRLMQSQRATKEAFTAKLPSLIDIPSYVPEQTLHQLQKDIIFMIGIIRTACLNQIGTFYENLTTSYHKLQTSSSNTTNILSQRSSLMLLQLTLYPCPSQELHPP